MPRRVSVPRTIAEAGEFGFLAALLPRLPVGAGTIVGPGHDCAVIRCGAHRYLFTVDTLVEGVHFRASWLSPRQIGRKSFLVNASDIAAMGGRPRFCVVSLAVPGSYPIRDLYALEKGIVQAADACGAVIVGGNLTRAAQLSVAVALLGEAPRRLVTRQGARAGDRVYVTGTLGDAGFALQYLSGARDGGVPVLPLRRFREPSPRLRAGRWLVESGLVSAMIDVSDGLVQDLAHICAASGVGAVVNAAQLPVSRVCRAALADPMALALSAGEDYELLCTVPEQNVKRLERTRNKLGCPITCIGEIVRGRRVRVLDAGGSMIRPEKFGYDHFGKHLK